MSAPLSHSQVLTLARSPSYVKPKVTPSAVKRWTTRRNTHVDSPWDSGHDSGSPRDSPQKLASDDVSVQQSPATSITRHTPRRVSVQQSPATSITRHTPRRVSDAPDGLPHTVGTGTADERSEYGCNGATRMDHGQPYDDAKARHKEVLHAWPDSCESPRLVVSSVSQFVISHLRSPPVQASRVPPSIPTTTTSGIGGAGAGAGAGAGTLVGTTTDKARRLNRFHPPVVHRGPESPDLVFQIGHPRNAVRPPKQARALLQLNESARSLRLANRKPHVWTASALDTLFGRLPADSARRHDLPRWRDVWRDAPLRPPSSSPRPPRTDSA